MKLSDMDFNSSVPPQEDPLATCACCGHVCENIDYDLLVCCICLDVLVPCNKCTGLDDY